MRRLLSSLARSSARATGRALSAHVVPDYLIPSWKTRKVVSSGYSLLTRAVRKPKKKKPRASGKPAKPAKKPLVIGGLLISRPKPKAPKEQFNKNAWAQGRAIAPPAGYDERPPSRSGSRSASSPSRPAGKWRQRFSDLRQEPRLVAQMGLDLLEAEYQLKKQSFLSRLRR